MKIYTKTGDSGTTSLVGGKRTAKNSPRIEAYGSIDELNSFVGLLASYFDEGEEQAFLIDIQNVLFDVGGYLATETDDLQRYAIRQISDGQIFALEHKIDEMNAELVQPKCFILPGGGVVASLAHVCRTVCRRAERRILDLQQEVAIYQNILRYINRLSDFFFVFARFVAKNNDKTEILNNNK